MMFLWFLVGAVSSKEIEYYQLVEKGIPDAEVPKILELHNKFRSLMGLKEPLPNQPQASNLQPLVYSTNLSELAQKSASKCHLLPQKNFSLKFPGQSEFVASSTAVIRDMWTSVFSSWASLCHYFDYLQPPTLNLLPYYELVGAFNEAVGCGYGKCANVSSMYGLIHLHHFVCVYGRKANYTGALPYETKAKTLQVCVY